MRSEFDIIHQYFTQPVTRTVLGIGDDAALISSPNDKQLVVSVDTLVSGQHFFADTNPHNLGYKALAVNLSDMAAMGANPRWTTLALTLPKALVHDNEAWLDAFSTGFFKLAETHQIELIGGDTTHGPLSITIQVIGEIENGKALLRSGAKPGDEIWISGHLGNAALAVSHEKQLITLESDEFTQCLPALHTPTARIELGRQLIDIAHSAIDISDGLIADLSHIIERSNVAAVIDVNDVSCSSILKKYLPQPVAVNCLLAGGDDYELCFTVPETKQKEVKKLSLKLAVPLTRIGKIKQGRGLTLLNSDDTMITPGIKGYDHFRT